MHNPLDVNDIDLIVISALRYAMGRKSYIVSVIHEFLLNHWENDKLKPKQKLFLRDIKNYIEDDIKIFNTDKNDPIHKQWERLYEILLHYGKLKTDNADFKALLISQ